jgi:hypothetical protein
VIAGCGGGVMSTVKPSAALCAVLPAGLVAVATAEKLVPFVRPVSVNDYLPFASSQGSFARRHAMRASC